MTEHSSEQTFTNLSGVSYGLSENLPPSFIAEPQRLIIYLKDGYSFFKANAALLTQRFKDSSKETIIVIVHPNSRRMRDVAAMDPYKIGKPEVQKSDCLQAVSVLHGIHQKILEETGEDCASRVIFRGHAIRPKWCGFFGDGTALIDQYPEHPHRGPMHRTTIVRDTGNYAQYVFGEYLSTINLLLERTKRPRANLWNYRLPKNLSDLRAGLG